MITIQILGTGCTKCKKLYENVSQAIKGRDDIEVKKVTDIMKIMKFDVIITPAIVINDKVVSSGEVLSVEDIKELL